jgi:hypothetical protein
MIHPSNYDVPHAITKKLQFKQLYEAIHFVLPVSKWLLNSLIF